jgi:hypothetical protein
MMKPGRLASVAGTAALIGSTVFAVGLPAASASTITQAYTCATPLGSESGSVTVAGSAALNATTNTIKLSGVKFTIHNPLSTTAISADHIVVRVPDPNNTSAPYVAGSAKVAARPPGWKAGHSTTGVFASHAGTLTLPAAGTLSNAALSATYSDKGPKGTVVSFKPGKVTFDLTSPITGSVACTPTAPVGTFASVTE